MKNNNRISYCYDYVQLYLLFFWTKPRYQQPVDVLIDVNMHSAKLLQHIMHTNPSKSLLKVITYIFRSVLSIIYGFYLMNRKVLLSYGDVWSHSLNLKFTGATYRAGIDYLSGAHGFIMSFKWGSCCLICRFPCSVLYIIVCPFILFLLVIYGFWLYFLVSSNLSSMVKIPCTSNRVSLVLWYWQFRRQWNWRRYCLK